MQKYIIQWANNMDDKVEKLEDVILRIESQRQDGETDEELATRVLNQYWRADVQYDTQGHWGMFYSSQTSIMPILKDRLARGKDYIAASPTKASLIATLVNLESQVHDIFFVKSGEEDLMKKMKENDTGNNMEYDKVITLLVDEIITKINPIGTKLTKMIMDINNGYYSASFDEVRMEFTLVMTTSTLVFGSATISGLIDQIAAEGIRLYEDLKNELHLNDNDYRPANYVNWLKSNMLDDMTDGDK